MQTIRQWLEQLGLPQYAQVFAENDVDLEALRFLTEGDLEKLGISLGNRKKLLNAIAQLDGSRPPAAFATDQPPDQEFPRAEAQRRQLTVMFCDLVGSTELATKLDPEQLRDLMQAYQRACGEVIARYDGHVAQYLGDGLMVYFGWPRAHEDDAARAIRAGLEVIWAVSHLGASTPVRARVGIHTGLVVVGETGQGDASVPKAAVGETPNIAARLQALAEPSSVVVSERTCSLARGLFDYTDLGSHALKGVTEPMHLFSVVGSRATESRFEAARGGVALTPLVGREEEVPLLLRRWHKARGGEGQVVLISGEPGIGKSRLTQVLREQIEGQPHTALRYQCSPYHLNSALYPIIEQFEFAAGFGREDSPEQKLDKMQAVLAGSEQQVAESAPLFAALLSLPTDRYPPLKLSPQKQKEKTFEALAGQIEALARKAPVLMVFEDAHWIDPTSQESLDVLLPHLHALPVLLVMTYRPEHTLAWVGQPNVTSLTLNRLGAREGAELVAKVTGGKALPQEVLDQILAHTDGVPLFIEELTKSVLESGLLRAEGDRYVLDGPLPPLAIPTTLRDSLIARLDRLAPVRELAQIGACIGREFSYELLAALSPLKGERLEEALEQLTKTGLVFRRGTPPDANYTFKHALVQDAAYDSLLKARRLQIHPQIAKVLEERFPAIAANHPEIVAHHYSAGGLFEKAVPCWLSAGERAIARSAYFEAVAHLRRGLEDLRFLAHDSASLTTELEFQIRLASALQATSGWAAEPTYKAYVRARHLCDELGDAAHLFAALYGEWVSHLTRGDREAPKVASRFLSSAEQRGDRKATLIGHRLLGHALWYSGNLAQARIHLEKTISLYDERTDAELAIKYGHDPLSIAMSNLSSALLNLGYPDQAMEQGMRAVAQARKLDHVHSLAYTACNLACVEVLVGDLVRANRTIEIAREVVHGYRFPHWMGYLTAVVGGFHIADNKPEEGARQLQAALPQLEATVFLQVHPVWLGWLASAHRLMGQRQEGLQVIDEALALVVRRGVYCYEPDLHREKGDLLCDTGPDAYSSAETAYQDSLVTARAQHGKWWELRTATSLARLWQAQGKRRQAYDLLAPIYNWFTEGFDTHDLKHAKALLEDLS